MKRDGFSLIEIIVALSLVGLIVLFLFGLLPSTGLLSQRAEHQVSATNLADEMVARLNSLSFSTLASNQGLLTPAMPGPMAPHLTERVLPDGTRLMPEIRLVTIPPTDHLIQATVSVRWKTQRKSHQHQVVRQISSVNR